MFQVVQHTCLHCCCCHHSCNWPRAVTIWWCNLWEVYAPAELAVCLYYTNSNKSSSKFW